MPSKRSKRKAILDSAVAVFAEKGFVQATVSEIAGGAGLGPSGVYIYFRNKEEILFAIIEKFLKDSCAGLTVQLEGIRGAENRLRKAIWYHCREYSGNRQKIQIVLASRSYPRFYTSKAYQALQQYAGMITDIIQEGLDEGVICGVSSPRVLRDMILGTVDHIAIGWSIQNSPNSLDQAETICDLVMNAVRHLKEEKKVPDKKTAKKKRIIDAATGLFARKGFHDASMLEIAKLAEVAEGTVYEYFGSKQNLLISIPRQKLDGLYESIRDASFEKRIRAILSSIFDFYYNERDYSTVLVLTLRTNRAFHRSESYRKLEEIFELIAAMIRKGQEKRIFREDLDLELCRNLLLGTLDHILIPWIIFKRAYDFRIVGEEVATLFFNAIKA